MNDLVVETLSTPESMTTIESLQREIWGYGAPGADPPYPARALLALAESGGLISLARIDGEPAGFSVAWLGRRSSDRVLYFHSQLTGVLSRFRRRGVGLQLKLHQREYAISQGLELMRWTFDPLRAANARLNLSRLGGVGSDFRMHYYGAVGSHFSQGDHSDRLVVEWHLQSRRVRSRLSRSGPPTEASSGDVAGTPITDCSTVMLSSGVEVRRLQGWRLEGDDTVWMEVPEDFELLRQQAPDLAAQWRRESGFLLTTLIEAGFLATDLVTVSKQGVSRPGYRLERRALAGVLESET